MEPDTAQQTDNDVGLTLRPAREDGLEGGGVHRYYGERKGQRSEPAATDV